MTFIDYFLKAKYSRRYKKPNGEWGYIYDFPKKNNNDSYDNIDAILHKLKDSWGNKDFAHKLNTVYNIIIDRENASGKTREQYKNTSEFRQFLSLISNESKKTYKNLHGLEKKYAKIKIENQIRNTLYNV